MWHSNTDRGFYGSFGLQGGVSVVPASFTEIQKNWIGIWRVWRPCQHLELYAPGIGTLPQGLTWSAKVFRWLMNVKVTSKNFNAKVGSKVSR